MYKKLISSLAIVTVIAIAFLINSCQLDTVSPPGTQNGPRDDAGNGCQTPNTFCGSPGTAIIQNSCPGDVTTIDLWAGVGNASAGVLVGQVIFTHVSGDMWHVKYDITNLDFEITEAHFDIECTLDGIPHTKNGNPKPGQFGYTTNSAPWEFDFTLPSGCTCFFVAAHAKGILGGHSCFEASLPPGCITASNMVHGFNTLVSGYEGCYASFDLSNAGAFSGNWCGWCMDCGTSLGQGQTFTCANLYSSLDPFPEGLKGIIEGWQNMDKVNYLLNHFHVGDIVTPLDGDCNPIPPEFGDPDTLSVMDIQAAIWSLLDVGTCLGGFTEDYTRWTTPGKINAILCDVNANGEGFVPSCANGDQIVFFVDPDPINHSVQPVLATAPCCGTSSEQTAWGDGKYGGQFQGPNWATYFKWCPTCP